MLFILHTNYLFLKNAFVCVADSKEDAIELSPDGAGKYKFENPKYDDWGQLRNSWVMSKDELDKKNDRRYKNKCSKFFIK